MQIIIKRKLRDYDTWKKVVSTLDGLRKQHGSRGGTVYRSAKDRNEVYLVFEWDDQKPYQTYFNLPEVKKALSDTGTTEIIEIGETFRLTE